MTLPQVIQILEVNEDLFYRYFVEQSRDLLMQGRLLDALKVKATQFVKEVKAQEQNEVARKTLLEQKLNPYFEALFALGLPNDLASNAVELTDVAAYSCPS